jgi:hypothetical protein
VPDAAHIARRPDAAARMTLIPPLSSMSVRCSRSWSTKGSSAPGD